MEFLATLLTATDAVGAKLLVGATLLAAISTIAMTIVETISNLWRGQMRLHRGLFRAWLRADLTAMWSRMHAWVGSGDDDAPKRSTLQDKGTTNAERQFLELACGDVVNAQILFDQPSDKFAAQLQAAANVALEYPTQYADLYTFLTRPLVSSSSSGAAAKNIAAGQPDTTIWLEFSRLDPAGQVDAAQAAAAMKARARLGNLVARRLDVFQNAARYRWDRLRQWLASLIAGLFAAGIASQIDWDKHEALIVPFVLLAGALAPFANDLANRLGGFKGKG